MKATFLLENLLGKLSFLNQAISTRAQLPVLSGFLIEAEKGKIKISATDLEIGVSASIPASVEEEGGLVVLAKPFSEFIQSLTEEKISIEKKENTVLLSGKKSKASILLMDASEFPSLLEDKGEEIATVKKRYRPKRFFKSCFRRSR